MEIEALTIWVQYTHVIFVKDLTTVIQAMKLMWEDSPSTWGTKPWSPSHTDHILKRSMINGESWRKGARWKQKWVLCWTPPSTNISKVIIKQVCITNLNCLFHGHRVPLQTNTAHYFTRNCEWNKLNLLSGTTFQLTPFNLWLNL